MTSVIGLADPLKLRRRAIPIGKTLNTKQLAYPL